MSFHSLAFNSFIFWKGEIIPLFRPIHFSCLWQRRRNEHTYTHTRIHTSGTNDLSSLMWRESLKNETPAYIYAPTASNIDEFRQLCTCFHHITFIFAVFTCLVTVNNKHTAISSWKKKISHLGFCAVLMCFIFTLVCLFVFKFLFCFLCLRLRLLNRGWWRFRRFEYSLFCVYIFFCINL